MVQGDFQAYDRAALGLGMMDSELDGPVGSRIAQPARIAAATRAHAHILSIMPGFQVLPASNSPAAGAWP